MGSSQSSTAETSTASGCENAKLLGDEILCGIISEQKSLAENIKSKSGLERTAQEKQINEITILQQKFIDYRKLVEEVKDQNIEQMRSEILKLKSDLEESKQKIEAVTKEKQDSENTFAKKAQDHKEAIKELNQKLSLTESSLQSERRMKTFLEKSAQQLKTVKEELEERTRKTEKLQRELDGSKLKLQTEITLKQELAAKLRENEYKTNSNLIYLREGLRKQTSLVLEMQETLKTTQQKLDSEIKAKKVMSDKFQLEIAKLNQEKDNLTRDYSSRNAERDDEISRSKTLIEEQANQLKRLNGNLKTKENELEQQKVSKKKVQAQLRVDKIKIVQLEAKLANLSQINGNCKDTSTQQKPLNQIAGTKEDTKNLNKYREVFNSKQEQLKELFGNFSSTEEKLKPEIDEELVKPEAKTENPETNKKVSKELDEKQKQLKEFYETLHNLSMTQGKLALLEESFKSLKYFCSKELGERKDFVGDFERHRQQGKNVHEKPLGETQKEDDSFLKEKMDFDRQLDQKTKEISVLKQQLKQKDTELQSMACAERSSSKKEEMNQLHNEFINSFRRFNEN